MSDPCDLRFAVAARRRPVALVQPGTTLPAAPCLATETDLAEPRGVVALEHPDGTGLAAQLADGTVALEVRTAGSAVPHRAVSRRHGRTGAPPTALAVTLTGPLAVAWTREHDTWVARSVVDVTLPLGGAPPLPHLHDGTWLAGLRATGERAGCFGQVGLRDLRLVTNVDGTPYVDAAQPRRRWLSATSAGPGGFGCAHASVWALDVDRLDLTHRADLFFTRPGPAAAGGRVGTYPDHAVHLVRDGDHWLVATSTWGDFDRRRHPHVRTMLANVAATCDDPTQGTHVLDAVDLALPTPGLRSVGTWDPHLLRTEGGWVVAFVSARRWFRFHPAVAAGPSLDALRLVAADPRRTATEGVTLDRAPSGGWRLLASDGRDSRRGQQARYPVLTPGPGLGLGEVGALQAAYPSNIPWPTLVPPTSGEDDWLLVGFDGRRRGGDLLGYGTHGDVVLQRPV